MDIVAQPLDAAVKLLKTLDIKYEISVTRPTRSIFVVEEDNFYVIRQHIDADGINHLVVAAKMGKEVF